MGPRKNPDLSCIALPQPAGPLLLPEVPGCMLYGKSGFIYIYIGLHDSQTDWKLYLVHVSAADFNLLCEV